MTWNIAPASVDTAEAEAVLRAYIDDIAGRYYARPATREEIDTTLAESPSDDLAPPHGTFLLAREADATRTAPGAVLGCVGVRLLSAKTAELKRVWVTPAARGCGLGSALIGAAEHAALDLGATTMRLDTRTDLVEARRLYGRHGYVEIPPYHHGKYADHWFEKRLA
ncbi:GNAT family N-acetyltransferase [Streptomyces sp. NPDC054796]